MPDLARTEFDTVDHRLVPAIVIQMLGITDLLLADLLEIDRALGLHFVPDHIRGRGTGLRAVDHPVDAEPAADALRGLLVADQIEDQLLAEIGRAAGRERVGQYV